MPIDPVSLKDRTRPPRVRLPAAISSAPPAIAEAGAELERLLRQHQASVDDLRRLNATRGTTEADDRRAAAEAAAEGKSLPASNLAKLEKQIDAANKLTEALGLASNTAYDVLMMALTEHGDEWRQQLEQQDADARAVVMSALADAGAAVVSADESERLRTWLQNAVTPSGHRGRRLAANLQGGGAHVQIGAATWPVPTLFEWIAQWAAAEPVRSQLPTEEVNQ